MQRTLVSESVAELMPTGLEMTCASSTDVQCHQPGNPPSVVAVQDKYLPMHPGLPAWAIGPRNERFGADGRDQCLHTCTYVRLAA